MNESREQGAQANEAGAKKPRFAIRPGRPRVEPTYQLSATIRALDGARVFPTQVVPHVLAWAAQKFPEPLPDNARDGAPFSLETGGQQLEAVAPHDAAFWAMRLKQPDAPFSDHRAVPGRTWISEVSLADRGDRTDIAVRVTCASLDYATAPIHLTRPRAVVDIAARFHVEQVRRLTPEPWFIESDADIEELFDLVTNDARRLPVFVLSETDPAHTTVPLDRFVLDPGRLAKRAHCLAHVAVIPRDFSYRWTDIVGKPWSVFRGAVRTYWPGLDFDRDLPTNHQLAFPNTIVFYRFEGDAGEEAFERFLVARAHQYAASKPFHAPGIPSFTDARLRAVELAREEARGGPDETAALARHVDALAVRVHELEDENATWIGDIDRLEAELRRVRNENYQLVLKADALQHRLREAGSTAEEPEQPLPETYGDIPDWVGQHLVGRLMLHPRAVRALKSAVYQDVSLVVQALQLLATEFRDMRMGNRGAKERFEQQCGELGLSMGGSIRRERAGQYGDEYFVRYPLESDRSEFLEEHLSKGSSKDARHALRIYFFWDAETQQVVVGWLPSHLQNRMT